MCHEPPPPPQIVTLCYTVEFEVITAVTMKGTFSWMLTPCSLEKAGDFAGTTRLHLQSVNASQTKQKKKAEGAGGDRTTDITQILKTILIISCRSYRATWICGWIRSSNFSITTRETIDDNSGNNDDNRYFSSSCFLSLEDSWTHMKPHMTCQYRHQNYI
jgi:hypothetical protein